MVVDTSAILAIVFGEPEERLFSNLLLRHPAPLISAASLVELTAVGTRRFAGRYDARIEYTLDAIRPAVCAVTEAHSSRARQAYRTFGFGSGHKAQLNFGDCFSYALAKELNEPLLFKGDDFAHTDITPAIPR